MSTHEQETQENYGAPVTNVDDRKSEFEAAPQPREQANWSEQQAVSDGDSRVTNHAEVSPSKESDRALFAEDDLEQLTARWDSVQAAFVDDPRECVQRADGLVSDVVKRITSDFSNARARLEDQWARGEEASTEDLRVALKQYREFFQRLLAV
jgi:hypothetical protein